MHKVAAGVMVGPGTPVRIRSLDFSEDGRFPAVIEIRLSDGYMFAISATDDEARQLAVDLLKRAEEECR